MFDCCLIYSTLSSSRAKNRFVVERSNACMLQGGVCEQDLCAWVFSSVYGFHGMEEGFVMDILLVDRWWTVIRICAESKLPYAVL